MALFYLALSALLRAALWVSFGRPDGMGPGQFAAALGVGLISDAAECAYLLMPFVVYLALVPERLYQSALHRFFLAAAVFAAIFGLIYLGAVEYFFFEEFDSRFNLVAVDYLIYPHEVFVNLWESYPIIWYLAADLVLSALVFWRLWPAAGREIGTDSPFKARAGVLALHLALLGIMALGFRSDRIDFSSNRVAEEIGSNGINSLFRAFRTQDLAYDLYYRTIEPGRAYALVREELSQMGGEFVSAEPTDLNRGFPEKPGGLGKLNVVVITVESLGAGFLGVYGDTRGLTPYLDKLAERSLLFKNVYATGTRTVRGLEAIFASLPPIPSEAVLKRPGCENIATWGQVMRSQGYDTSFLYGGFGAFDNMNYFFSQNGFAISDRTDIKDVEFGNIWGVSDGDLYRHALQYYDGLARRAQPFFSIVLTTSNHKPYTFPEGVPGVPPRGGGRDAGVRYTDYAVGKFMEEAEKHEWFANTLFLITGDHDARVYGRQQIPMERYKVPLLIYAPAKVRPDAIEKIISQMDIAPTVLGLLGLSYTAPFYGQDVLAESAPPSPVLVNHNHDVALFKDGLLTVLSLQQEVRTFRYDPTTHDQTETEPDAALTDLTIAYYQTAYDQFQSHRYMVGR